MSTSLTLLHLRFDLIVRSTLQLGGMRSGERLRNALANIMLRAVCPETHRRTKPTPEHAAVCPVCWLLAAEVDPGEVRRAYSLVPPYHLPDVLKPGECFSFVLTLFGQGMNYLPYFILAVPAMGETGVGPGRGKFELQAVCALNPSTYHIEYVLAPGQRMVRIPSMQMSWHQAFCAAQNLLQDMPDNRLKLHFVTPARLIFDQHLVKTPDFGVFFRRMLARLDDIGRQYAAQDRRLPHELQSLNNMADQVRLVEQDIHWVDLFSYSGRTQTKSPMGGFTGTAIYQSHHWHELLPWLYFSQALQVGKSAVKGNGVFEIATSMQPAYWEWALTTDLSSKESV